MSSHATTMMNAQVGSQQSQQQRFTRYKSVRKATRSQAPEEGNSQAPPVSHQQANVALSRSMSRYKRPRAQTTGTGGNIQDMPAMPSRMALQQHQQHAATVQANSARQRNASLPNNGYQVQLPSRSRTNVDTQQQQQQQQQQLASPTRQQPRRNTQSSRTQQMPAAIASQAQLDPYAQANQPGQYVVTVPAYPANMAANGGQVMINGLQMANGAHQALTMPATEEDRVRGMIEADKLRQKRLRDEQKHREAKLAAEKAEKQRQEEEEQLKKEEDIARKEEEEQLIKDKLEEARRQHAERKKLEKQQSSRGLFSRGRASSHTVEKHHQSSNEYGRRYESTHEVAVPIEDIPELPSKKVDKVITRPYQSPPSKTRKESLSQSISASSPQSPPRQLRKESISSPISGPGRPSISQRPADPFFDAPITAANNAGGRSTIVEYGPIRGVVTVDSDMTVEDLLQSAAKEMPNANIDPKSDVLMECFNQQEHQGLERRMRRYEVVQKVMDSWDYDRKNKFGIIKGNIGGSDGDLYASAAISKGEPRDTVKARMYYSCATPSTKPSWGTFDKPQTCILRTDGQILVGKSDDDFSASNVCHMADFEIFIPTPEQMKRIKPKSKKMFVFAVKSMNKAAVYADSNNYVHYFCTKDREDADRWYVAVQGWRSWYMVERLGYGGGGASGGFIGKLSMEQSNGVGLNSGAGNKAAATAVANTGAGGPPTGGLLGSFMGSGNGGDDIFSSIMKKYDNDGPDLSKDALGYDLGGLISRIPANEHSYDEPGSSQTISINNRTASGKPMDRRGGPPTSFPANLKGAGATGTGEPEPFAPGGLLGRSYSQRKAQQEITGRTSLDRSGMTKKDMDWGRPLVDFSSEANANGKISGSGLARMASTKKGHGPLIDRM